MMLACVGCARQESSSRNYKAPVQKPERLLFTKFVAGMGLFVVITLYQLFGLSINGNAYAACTKSKTLDEISRKGKAVENFEKLVFLSAPNLKPFISYFDIDIKDCHLMVWIKDPMMKAAASDQETIYKAIQKLWGETRYVRTDYWSNSVEIKYFNFNTLKETMVKFLQ